MNKKQLNMIYRLIDIHTSERNGYRESIREIDEPSIKKLKEDIKLFLEDEDKQDETN